MSDPMTATMSSKRPSTTIRERLRELAAKAPDPPPWIRRWESLDVHGMRGDGVFMDQRNIDLAVAAVNELPALLTELDTLERRAEAATKALREVIAADTAAENGDEAADRRWDEALAAARSLSSQEGQK